MFVCFTAHYTGLEEKLQEAKEARVSLNAMRRQHMEKVRQQEAEMEMLARIQMQQKLELLRQQKSEQAQYLEDLQKSRQSALQQNLQQPQQPQVSEAERCSAVLQLLHVPKKFQTSSALHLGFIVARCVCNCKHTSCVSMCRPLWQGIIHRQLRRHQLFQGQFLHRRTCQHRLKLLRHTQQLPWLVFRHQCLQ